MEEYKKYIAVVRELVGGKWILRQTDEGLEIRNDTCSDDYDGWTYWCDYDMFKQIWIDEKMNPEHIEYEDNIFIESFDKLEDAVEWLENNHTHISPPSYNFDFQ